jgi:hypothetical protein
MKRGENRQVIPFTARPNTSARFYFYDYERFRRDGWRGCCSRYDDGICWGGTSYKFLAQPWEQRGEAITDADEPRT